MVRCLEENTLFEYIHDGLDDEARAAIGEHAAGCEDCRQLIVAALRALPSTGAEGREAAPETDRETEETAQGTVETRTRITRAGPDDVTAQPRVVTGRPPAELAREDRVIAGKYRLVRLLGSGGMGAVHEAVNTWTGRRVAIKQLLGALAAEPTVGQRFALEARSASRIAHPNVVEILDLGEDPQTGALFMVQELLDGETLRQRLHARGALPVDEVLRMLAPAVDALAVAHGAGVIHRDLKPENIFLARDAGGEVTKLIDFGLSKQLPAEGNAGDAGGDGAGVHGDLALTEHGRQLGTPYYMSPEQLRGAADVDGRSDVWSIGVVLFEAVAGARPFVGPTYNELVVQILKAPLPALGPTVPAAFAALIGRALQRDRANRISIRALRDALDELVRRPDARTVPRGNPYRGLLPFDAAHRGVFFGRAADIAAVLDRVKRAPFTLVAGDSGVGKSSVIRAGVLPALDRVISLVPGRQPLAALGQALAAVVDAGHPADLASMLADDPAAAGARLHAAIGETPLILFIDQLEELLTLADAGDAAATTTALWVLLDAVPPLRLVATLRSDFLGRLAALPGIGDEVTGALYLLRPLTAAGVREAIVGPARVTGLGFESPALVDELVASAGATGGELPLLQFALAELWEARDVASGTIRAASLASIGGVTGALARHADGVLAGLGPRYRLLARHVLTALVTADGTRARRTLAELRDAAAGLDAADARELGGEAIGAVLDALVAGRLVTIERAADETYQIAHDVLVDGWDTLRGWRGHDIERGVVLQRLARSAAEWERLGRPAQLLWQAPQLAELGALASDAPFLAQSRRAVRRRRLARRALALGIPLLVGVGVAGARLAIHRRTAAEIAEHVAAADAAMARGAIGAVDLEHGRLAAFALFDARRTEPGEDAWSSVLQHQRGLDDTYREAAEQLEAALALDGSEPGVRQRFAQLAYDRAALAERTYRRNDRDDQVHRMLAYDDDGRQRARWTAPATLAVATDARAPVTAQPLADDRDRRHYGAPIALGTSPLSASLAPGSYLITLHADPDVRLPVELGRGERLALELQRPDAVPAGYVFIPPGRFLYGSADDEDMRRTMLNAQPLHQVATDGYLIARHEVTFGDWIAFLRAQPPAARAALLPHSAPSAAQYAGARVALDEPSPGRFRLTFQPTSHAYVVEGDQAIHYADRASGAYQRWLDLPVSGVSWEDARAYTAWLDHTLPGARPCDDHEWERAARGADDRLFPHGDRISPPDADLAETYGRQPAAFGPDAVGSHPASDSPFGVSDLTGNDWELVASLHGDGEVAIRGGSWYHNAFAARLNNREPVEPTLRTVVVGLRICASRPARPVR